MSIKRFFKLLRRYILIFWLKGKQKIKTASGDKNAGLGDKMVEARRRSVRHGDVFTGPGGHPANLEARR